MDHWLDRGFFAFHSLLIAFNMTGWAWKKTRVLHLIVLLLILLSWTVLGISFGWGYCPCTDWHFRARRRLGLAVPETSFIQLLAREAMGLDLGKTTADALSAGVLGAIVVATAATWAREWRRRSGRLPPQDRAPVV